MNLDVLYTVGALVVGVVGGLVLRPYITSYAAEKGKNLATKEDVQGITAQIEKVKADIHLLGQLKTDYEQQRREWLLRFYDSAVELMYDRFAVNFGDIPFDGGRSLFEYQQNFRLNISQLLKAYQRIVIYFRHEDMVRGHAEEVLNAALESRKVMSKKFGAIKTTSIEEELAFQSADKSRVAGAAAESDIANKAFWDEMRPVADEFQRALRAYLTAVNIYLGGGP